MYVRKLSNPNIFLKGEDGQPVVPADWTDVRLFKTQNSDGSLNEEVFELHKKFVNLVQKLGADGIRADVADQSVVYINTQKDCGTKCKIYLDRPEEKQILYRWSPLTEIITDNTKEKIEIITNKRKHILFVKKDIKEIEINSENLSSKIKKIKGLEKLPKLENIKFIGFDL